MKIYEMVVNMNKIMNNMPCQIERQQPVYLLDALGRYCPFHLEFIQSYEVSHIPSFMFQEA
jgi:hypothetical protein